MMTSTTPSQAVVPFCDAFGVLNRLLSGISLFSLKLLDMSSKGQNRAGFVLAGGKSARMGTDKVFMVVDGQTLLERALGVVSSVCDYVRIVGEPRKFSTLGTDAIRDIFPGCGPLAGIHAALARSPYELNLMLAVDMPFVPANLLDFLFAAADKVAALVTVPRLNAQLQPLCAVYRREFSGKAEAALQSGNYKIEAAFSGVSVRVIEEAELAEAGFSVRHFFNMNTPQDIP
jgi:molybdopterin-guanine dinucleotide biosynthesis protein A